MTLSFTQKWGKSMGDLAGQPNYFVEKIYRGFFIKKTLPFIELNKEYSKVKGAEMVSFLEVQSYRNQLHPKLHTIREDKSNRWRPGMNIHFVVNNRTKNRFQFAPVFKCVSVQEIEIINLFNDQKIKVDRKWLSNSEIEQLAINDGFPSVEAFFNFFNNVDYTGKIIHWTNKRY